MMRIWQGGWVHVGRGRANSLKRALFLLAALSSAPLAAQMTPSTEPASAGTSFCAVQNPLSSVRAAIGLLDAVSREGEQNAALSPLGVETVLAMMSHGATAPLRRALSAMFDADSTNENRLSACLPGAIHAGADAGVDLRIANGVFVDRGLDLFPAFAAVLEDRFGATVSRLRFRNAGAVDMINAWGARATDGAVPRLVDGLDAEEVLALVNAVHFRGLWAHAFDPSLTELLPFHPASGETAPTPTMVANDLLVRYRENENFQAVELPYGAGRHVLTAVLPRQGLASATAFAQLAADPSWLIGSGFHRSVGHLTLPRLDLHSRSGILPALKSLGLEQALSDPDAFAGIAAPAPALSRVLHAVRLTLDEQGTEAVAATAAMFSTRNAATEEVRFEMALDRPFVLAVRDRESDRLLFAAWVAETGAGP